MLALKIFNLLTFIITIVFNGLTTRSFGPFKPISNISRQYETILTPPNWAFGIWGVIYTGLLLFTIAQFVPSFKLDNALSQIGGYFIVTNLLNIAWLLIFSVGKNWSIYVSSIVIGFLFLCLVIIQLKTNMFHKKGWQTLFVDIPFSLYLGWIFFAFVVNLSILFKILVDYSDIENVFFIIIFSCISLCYLLNYLFFKNSVTMLVFFYICVAFYVKFQTNDLLKNAIGGLFIFNLVSFVLAIICRTFSKKNKFSKKQKNIKYYYNEMDDDV